MILYNRIWGIKMNNNIKITIDGNKIVEVPAGTTYLEISQYSKYKDTVLGVKKNNEILSLNEQVYNNETIEFFDCTSIDGTKMYKAAVMFIFEVALKTIYPNADIHYLHSVPGGILGEIKYSKILTIEDISKIKEEMAHIIDNDYQYHYRHTFKY